MCAKREDDHREFDSCPLTGLFCQPDEPRFKRTVLYEEEDDEEDEVSDEADETLEPAWIEEKHGWPSSS